MAIANGSFLRWTVKCEQYLQEVSNSIDYRLAVGNDLPLEECCEDLRSIWRTWVLGRQHSDLHVVEYKLQVYGGPSDYLPEDAEKRRIRHNFTDEFIRPGLGDGGALGGTPLPTFVAVTARKITTGLPRRLLYTGDITSPNALDSRFRGGIRFGAITETQTKDAQGNELATVTGSNWLNSWQSSVDILKQLAMQEGVVGQAYRLDMQVRSDYATGNNIRGLEGASSILFREVSSIAVSKFVGSQTSRKQRQKFQ